VWPYPRPDYIFQVSSKSVQGFRSPRGGQNLAFPITLASRFYNSLYYRTSRDFLNLTINVFLQKFNLTASNLAQYRRSSFWTPSKLYLLKSKVADGH